jgi:glycine cleavage system H protein
MVPADRRYSKEHEWIRVEGGVGTVGITDYAQQALGDVVFVELPKPGTRLTKGQTMGTVESVKAVSDIYSPVGGEVLEINESLAQSPEQINSDPHGAAWLAKIRLTNPDDISSLMDAVAYEAYIAEKDKETSA